MRLSPPETLFWMILWILSSSCLSFRTASRYSRSFVQLESNSLALARRMSAASSTTSATDETLEPPKRKFHHWTVCMVPPETSVDIWNKLTATRSELRDPGLYRWPPHANLLYPFVDSLETGDDGQRRVNMEVIDRLQSACRQCEPFSVRLAEFGTFGGRHRGVLWLYPDSRHCENGEPLKDLQALLEEQFPYCSDQRKVGGIYNPHITLSHFVDLETAQSAQAKVEADWPLLECIIDRIYLLHRQGDAGQFEIVAEIPLGREPSFETLLYRPSRRFAHMPEIEVDWVRDERIKLKQRRNGSQRRRGRRPRSRSPRVPDSPQVVAAKRAERQAKREAAAQAKEETSVDHQS